jgi:hypothetical protein
MVRRFARIGAIVAVGTFVALGSSIARAQESRHLTVAGAMEYTRITDDESFLGAGLGAAGALGWRFTDATSLEVEVGRTHHVRDLNLFAVVHDAQGHVEPIPYTQRWEGTATFYIASIAHAFGSSSVRPVVWGGGGLMTHGGTRRGPVVTPQVPAGFSLQTGDAVTTRGQSSQALAIDGGVGLEIRVAPRVTVRPFAGLRLANTGNFGPKYLVRTGVRVGFQ